MTTTRPSVTAPSIVPTRSKRVTGRQAGCALHPLLAGPLQCEDVVHELGHGAGGEPGPSLGHTDVPVAELVDAFVVELVAGVEQEPTHELAAVREIVEQRAACQRLVVERGQEHAGVRQVLECGGELARDVLEAAAERVGALRPRRRGRRSPERVVDACDEVIGDTTHEAAVPDADDVQIHRNRQPDHRCRWHTELGGQLAHELAQGAHDPTATATATVASATTRGSESSSRARTSARIASPSTS